MTYDRQHKAHVEMSSKQKILALFTPLELHCSAHTEQIGLRRQTIWLELGPQLLEGDTFFGCASLNTQVACEKNKIFKFDKRSMYFFFI